MRLLMIRLKWWPCQFDLIRRIARMTMESLQRWSDPSSPVMKSWLRSKGQERQSYSWIRRGMPMKLVRQTSIQIYKRGCQNSVLLWSNGLRHPGCQTFWYYCQRSCEKCYLGTTCRILTWYRKSDWPWSGRGSHVEIGTELARNKGTIQWLSILQASHHGDVEPESVIASLSLQRMPWVQPDLEHEESLESYIKRLQDLEGIANSFEGVKTSFALQAGRNPYYG